MGLDSRIALGTQTPQINSPFQTLGQLAQLRAFQEDRQQRQIMNQQENERRDLMLRDRRDAEENQAMFQTLVQQRGSIDDALDEMDRQGRSQFAVDLRGKVNAERLKALDLEAKRGANQLQALKTVAQIWSGVSDDNTHQTAIPASRAMFKANGLDPSLIDHMGPHYDEQVTPKLIEDAMKWGGQQEAVLAARKAAYDAANQGISVAKDARERDEYFTKSLASFLPTVQSPEEWKAALDHAAILGAPPQTIAKFPKEFSPRAIEQARQVGLTPEQRVSGQTDTTRLALEAKRVALEGRRVNLAEQEAKDAAAGGGRALTPNRLSEIADTQQKEYAALEKDIRDAVDTQTKGSDGKWYGSTVTTLPKGVTLTGVTRTVIPDEVKAGIAQRKLAIENGFRARRNLPSLEQTELQLATDPEKAKDLRIIRNRYKMLTGQAMPLERLMKLKQEEATTKDPARRAAIRNEAAELRELIRNLGGR